MGLVQNMMGMGGMTEQVIATDFLLSAKEAVKNYSVAVSEAVTPVVKEILKRHLFTAIDTHEKIMAYMSDMGYYDAHDFSQQLHIDLKAADTVLSMQES